MGTLSPGVTYIYERAEGIIYAREFGKTERRVVGYETGKDYDSIGSNQRLFTELNEIVKMAETDPAMQELLDRMLVLYNLKKNNE